MKLTTVVAVVIEFSSSTKEKKKKKFFSTLSQESQLSCVRTVCSDIAVGTADCLVYHLWWKPGEDCQPPAVAAAE